MSRADSQKGRPDLWAWAIVSIVILTIAAMRIRLLAMPLERDEGEYAYIGQLLLHGIPPFKLAYTMKLPGTALMYAVFMTFFGQSPTGIHLGLLMVNAITIILVFLLGRKLLGNYMARPAACTILRHNVSELFGPRPGCSCHSFCRGFRHGRLLHFPACR